jgi:hypothetical protein
MIWGPLRVYIRILSHLKCKLKVSLYKNCVCRPNVHHPCSTCPKSMQNRMLRGGNPRDYAKLVGITKNFGVAYKGKSLHMYVHACMCICCMYVLQPKLLGASIHANTFKYAHTDIIHAQYAQHMHSICTTYIRIHVYHDTCNSHMGYAADGGCMYLHVYAQMCIRNV